MLADAEHAYSPAPSGKWAEAEPYGYYQRKQLLWTAPTEMSDGLIPVFANHGRWVVQCPCGSAQIASRTDHRFFCPECNNEAAGGAWIKTHWPTNTDELEAVLGPRNGVNQNWRVGESIKSLKAENTLHGVGTNGVD